MNQAFVKKVSRKAVISAGKLVMDKFRRDVFNSSQIEDVAARVSRSSRDLMIDVIDGFLPIKDQLTNDHFTRLQISAGEIHLVHLDGKEAFVYGQHNFSLGISYVLNGRTQLSGVFNPYYKELFFAENDQQLKRNNQVTMVNEVSRLSDSFLGFSYRGSYDSEGQKKLNMIFGMMRQPVRTMIPGSDLFGLSLVANGNLTGMILATPVLEYIAPGLFVVEAAGGKVTDLFGDEVTDNTEFVVVSNGLVHKELLSQIAQLSAVAQ